MEAIELVKVRKLIPLAIMVLLLAAGLIAAAALLPNEITRPSSVIPTRLSLVQVSLEDFSVNITVFRTVNEWRSPQFDQLFRIVRLAGSGYALLPITLMVALFRRKTLKQLLASVAATTIICIVLKHVVPQPRPDALLGNVHHLYALTRCSFPSSDTAVTFAVAFSLLPQVPKWLKVSLIIYALLVGYGRMYVGVHFPLDVVAGALIGTLCSIGTASLLRSPSATKSQPKPFSVAFESDEATL